MGNIVSAASAFRLSKSYLPSHSTFYNAVSMSLRSFADAVRMWCAEAKDDYDKALAYRDRCSPYVVC